MDLLESQNQRYRKFIIGTAVVIALTIIFAPMALFSDSGVIGACGHRLLTAPAACSERNYMLARVDYPVLITYWIGILLIAYFLHLHFKVKIDTWLMKENVKTLESEFDRLSEELENGIIDKVEYESRKTFAIVNYIDNQTTLKIAQAYNGSMLEPDIIRRVHISPDEPLPND